MVSSDAECSWALYFVTKTKIKISGYFNKLEIKNSYILNSFILDQGPNIQIIIVLLCISNKGFKGRML